jgi:glycosyltransferase involved in cell wall biosynthesis
MPLVSVIIPTYNSEAYLAQTLDSVERQTFKDFEVVLVDDGSHDATLRVARRFTSAFDLRIIVQPNAGPAAARNTGIRAARGRYCAFLDADDLMLPERLAVQAALLDKQPQLGLLHTDLMTFDDNGILHRTRRAFSDPCGGRILDRLLIDNFITTSTVMAPTERLIAAGLFNVRRRVSEDFELWLIMAERGPVAYIECPLVHYRYRPGSLSADKLSMGLAALAVIESFWSSHADYGKRHPAVWRRSLAAHLSFAGAAALQRRRPGAALGYLLRSLSYNAASASTWKHLARVALPPWRGRVAAGPPDPGNAAGTI